MNIGKIKKFLLKLLKLLGYLVIAFVCFCVAFLVYYIISSQIHANDEDYKPAVSIYTIVSPSMTPVINVYDVVVNTRVSDPNDVQVGDIITYVSKAPTSEGMTITHRVVAITKAEDGTVEYMTQGDNNSEPDSLYVRYDQVIGKEIFVIPLIGRLQFLLANQKGWLFLLLIPISIYVLFEIYKLIDLFGLRKKVNNIVGTTEESYIERKKEQKQLEIARKNAIKEELKLETQYKDSLIRSEKESAGFLEAYNETIYTVAKNKYIKPVKEEKTTKTKTTEIPVQVSTGKVEPVKEKLEKVEKVEKVEKPEIELPKIKENPFVINKPIEILDTDELTTKIKEYDTKIEKLDKMIADIEKIPVPEKKAKAEIVEKDNYLTKKKIKVKAVEPTKNQKKPAPTKRKKKVEEPKIEFKPSLTQTIELTQITNLENKRMKVERPETEDIKVVRERDLAPKEEKKPTKKKLNLNPNKIKTVTRKTTKKTEVEVEKNVTPKVETKEVLPPKVTIEINRNQTTPKKEVEKVIEPIPERKIEVTKEEVPTETTIEINRRINQVPSRKVTKTTTNYEEESNKKVKVELNREFEKNVEETEKKKYPPLIEIRKVR